jgi:predicted transposase YdaD
VGTDRRSRSKPTEANELTVAMHILMGLRYDSKEVDRLLKGVRSMEESSTYQAILEKGIEKGIEKGLRRGVEQGRLEEARSTLLRVGGKFLGAPGSAAAARVEGIAAWKRLEALTDRVLEGGVASWDELLGPA